MPANFSNIPRHLPLITPRIEYFHSRHYDAPLLITPRIDFDLKSAYPYNNGDIEMESNDDADSSKLHTDNNSDSDDDDSDVADEFLGDKPIPKPAGQPGRPGSGGYKLDDVLIGWGPRLISAVTRTVKEKADEMLITHKSYCHQDAKSLAAICEQTQEKYPILKKYKNCWPVHDMLKLHLKYTRTRTKAPVAGSSTRALRSNS